MLLACTKFLSGLVIFLELSRIFLGHLRIVPDWGNIVKYWTKSGFREFHHLSLTKYLKLIQNTKWPGCNYPSENTYYLLISYHRLSEINWHPALIRTWWLYFEGCHFSRWENHHIVSSCRGSLYLTSCPAESTITAS